MDLDVHIMVLQIAPSRARLILYQQGMFCNTRFRRLTRRFEGARTGTDQLEPRAVAGLDARDYRRMQKIIQGMRRELLLHTTAIL